MNKLLAASVVGLFSIAASASSVSYLCKVSKAGNGYLKKNASYTLEVQQQGNNVFATLSSGSKKLEAHKEGASNAKLVSTSEDDKNDFYTEANQVNVFLSQALLSGDRSGSMRITPVWSDDYSKSDDLNCSMLNK